MGKEKMKDNIDLEESLKECKRKMNLFDRAMSGDTKALIDASIECGLYDSDSPEIKHFPCL